MALERVGGDAVRTRQVAELQHHGIAEVDLRLVGVRLDQDAAGAAVADVEHEVHRHRPGEGFVRHGVDQLDGAGPHDALDEAHEGDVARHMFEAVVERVPVEGPAGPLGPLEIVKDALQPGRQPFLVIADAVGGGVGPLVAKEPAEVVEAMREGELALVQSVVAQRRVIDGAARTRRELGVEGQHQRVSAAGGGRLRGEQAGPRPVARPLVEKRRAVRLAPGPQGKERHRHPAADERLQCLGVGHVVFVVARRRAEGGRAVWVRFVVARQELDIGQPVRPDPVRSLSLDEAARAAGCRLQIEGKGQELDAAVRHQSDRLAVRPLHRSHLRNPHSQPSRWCVRL